MASRAAKPSQNGVVISRADIEAAAARLTGVIHRTPIDRVAGISAIAGRPLAIKCEHLQRTGSYKIRGAYNLIAQLDDGVDVVAASAGNHAQGVALAARLLGHRATIYMPATAALPKIEATRSYGATVELVGDGVDGCIGAAKDHAANTGAVFVPPFDDARVIAGQGTVGLEMCEQAPEIEAVVVPVGGGGLISGVATAFGNTRRDVKVIGVEAAGAAAMRASLDAGRVVTLDDIDTMADGIAVRAPSELTLAHVKAYVDNIVTVDEEAISQTLLLLLERAKQVVEPAGAVALAAVLGGLIPGSGPVGVVISGGNVDPLLLGRVIDHGMSAAGRYLVLRVVVGDAPGELARLLKAVAEQGLNVLSVEHFRSGTHVGINKVEVRLTLETRDPSHRGEVVRAVQAAGFAASEA